MYTYIYNKLWININIKKKRNIYIYMYINIENIEIYRKYIKHRNILKQIEKYGANKSIEAVHFFDAFFAKHCKPTSKKFALANQFR